MRVALVFNPFSYKLHEENLRIVQKYFGLFPPLSLAWVAAIIEKAGHEALIIDARTLRLTKAETLERVRAFKPALLGYMMTTYMYPETLEWIRFIRKGYDAPVIVGGYNLRVYPRESVMPPEIDFGCVEHAYYTVPALLRELEGGRNWASVPGLVYKEKDRIIVNPHPQEIDFDRFPSPARHLLPNELYAEFPTERKNFTVMVTSLGCPRKCGFCEAGGSAYKPRSPETVLAEMEECSARHGVREIDIFDYEFTAVRERVLAICRGIKERGLDILWACRARIDTVDKELLEEMRSAGCGRIYFGVESGVPAILERIKKGITVEQARDTVRAARKAGIKCLGFFLVGAPGETRQTVRETVRFAARLDLDYVQFSKCLAKPLTPLWKEMVATTGRDYWKEWVLGTETDHPLPRPWTALSNEEIDALAKWAYIRFHRRIPFLIRSAFRVRSFAEFKRKLSGFLDMLFSQENVSARDVHFKAYNENKRKLNWYKKMSKWSLPF